MIIAKDSSLHIGGWYAEELVCRYGTPLYVYDEDTALLRLNEVLSSTRDVVSKILYSMKANSNPSIVKLFYEQGLGIEASSPGEVFIALKSSVKPGEIVFTGNNVSYEDLKYVVKCGVSINIDSLSALRKLQKIGYKGSIGIRVNPLFKYGNHEYFITSGPRAKFGIPLDKVYEIIKEARSYGIVVKRLHAHIGSGIKDTEPYLKLLDILVRAAQKAESVEELNIGGGYAVPYKKDEQRFSWFKFASELKSKKQELNLEDYKIMIESGRYLIAEAGVLLARITDVRKIEEDFYIIGTDTGMNHLIRPALYGAYHEVIVANKACEKPKIRADIVGNLCEGSDIIALNRELPEVSEGDLIAVMNVGAYGFSMASNYNSRLLPAEVLVRRSGEVLVIRRRQSFEQLLKDCQVI